MVKWVEETDLTSKQKHYLVCPQKTWLLNHSSTQGSSWHSQLYLMQHMWEKRWNSSNPFDASAGIFKEKKKEIITITWWCNTSVTYQLTCSSNKMSSNTRPVVSTGSNTFPPAFRVFSMLSVVNKGLGMHKYWNQKTKQNKKKHNNKNNLHVSQVQSMNHWTLLEDW